MTIEHSIETLSGRMFDFDQPSPAAIDVRDIAAALGNTCRFGGHVTEYYSVAEHAVLVYQLVKAADWPPGLCYAALHHDSHEAYLGDIPKPLKRTLGSSWRYQERAVDWSLCQALGVNYAALSHPAIKDADEQALSWEAAVLKPSGRAQLRETDWVSARADEVPSWAVQCWTPTQAAKRFLAAHERVCLAA